MTGFTFNGTTSQSLGLLVTALNPYNSASRRVETIEIPYRNGNLIIDSGTYDNIMVSYEVSVIGNTKTTCDAVNEWLSGSQGYCILSDTVNTEFFRVGYFASSIEYVLTALYREGKATLNFDCFPQKYLNSNTTMTRNATSTTTTAEGGTFSSHVYPLPIELKGNTTQTTYSGKQMYTLTDGTYTVDTITATVSNGIISISGSTSTTAFIVIALNTNISLTNGERYTMALFNPTANANVYLRIVGNGIYDTIADAVNKTQAFIYDSANTYYNDHITIRVASGTSLTNFKLQPMLVKGNTAGDYEPYVGGISSPNPDYPQTIHNVSGDNNIMVMGKNILDLHNGISSGSNSGITVSKYDNGTYSLKGTATATTPNIWLLGAYGTYSGYTSYDALDKSLILFSFPAGTYKFRECAIFFIHEDGTKANYNASIGNTNTFTTSKIAHVVAIRAPQVTNGAVYDTTIFPQLESGSTGTPFEEYKGITYHFPLPIENVLNNTATSQTKNNIVFTVNDDKTILANGKANSTSNLSLGTVTLSANTTYFISGCPSGGGSGKYRLELHDSGDTLVAYDSGSGVSYTPSTTGTYTLLLVYWYNFVLTDLLFKPQIERGTKANTYRTYGTSPIELRKIGNYQDYFYKSNVTGKWYVHKEIGKKVLDGTEAWNSTTSIASGTTRFYYDDSIYFNDGNTSSNVVYVASNMFTAMGWTSIYQNDTTTLDGIALYASNNSTKRIVIRIENTYASDVPTFKTWLETNQPIVYYVLATSTNTEITDATLLSQLNAIDNAMAFETSTTISQVNNDAPFLLTYTNIGSATVSSNYRGEPIITVNDTGYIYINGASIKVNQVPMTINSQTMQAYNGNINLNNYIELNEFPMLKKGNNDIGSTMALSIVPNYWKL